MELNNELLKRYTVKTEKISNGPGYWDSLLVEIFDNSVFSDCSVKIGEYKRNHYSLYNTFHPFEKNGNHYALYSKDYTATRVMSLPDCRDLGGEERDSMGFCPVDFAVPYDEYEIPDNLDPVNDPEPTGNPRHNPKKWADITSEEGRTIYGWPDKEHPRYEAYQAACDDFDARHRAWRERHPFVTRRFNGEFGFVAGCIWGDDTSWKIEYLDLSEVENGIIRRYDKFGIELPSEIDLKDAICFREYYPPDEVCIEIAHRQLFDLRKTYQRDWNVQLFKPIG